jgi:hypothetical protein
VSGPISSDPVIIYIEPHQTRLAHRQGVSVMFLVHSRLALTLELWYYDMPGNGQTVVLTNSLAPRVDPPSLFIEPTVQLGS